MDSHEDQYPGRTAFLKKWSSANREQKVELWDEAEKYGVISKNNTIEDYYRRAQKQAEGRARPLTRATDGPRPKRAR